MSNLAIAKRSVGIAGWEYLVNALDGFWCVQLRSKEAGDQGGETGTKLVPRPSHAPWKGGASYPCSATLVAERKGLLPAPCPSASSGDHSDCIVGLRPPCDGALFISIVL